MCTWKNIKFTGDFSDLITSSSANALAGCKNCLADILTFEIVEDHADSFFFFRKLFCKRSFSFLKQLIYTAITGFLVTVEADIMKLTINKRLYRGNKSLILHRRRK